VRDFFDYRFTRDGHLMNTNTIGFVAAILTTVSFLPQVLKVWQTRSARDVSLGMYLLLSLGVALWLIYGVFIHSWPIILSNLITLILASIVLAMKVKFG
jgi:MtN3 and saliva related transmembrane protein